MGDANFRKLFPAQSGFGTVLIDLTDVPADQRAERQTQLASRLGSELEDFSVSVDTTSARLKTYQEVQNTYLETFQTLGALGMMLGTVGLSVVLVRTVIERRGELALLARWIYRVVADNACACREYLLVAARPDSRHGQCRDRNPPGGGARNRGRSMRCR